MALWTTAWEIDHGHEVELLLGDPTGRLYARIVKIVGSRMSDGEIPADASPVVKTYELPRLGGRLEQGAGSANPAL